MDLSIHVGTWAVPFITTGFLYILAWALARDDTWGLVKIFFALIATILSLATWLIWALLD